MKHYYYYEGGDMGDECVCTENQVLEIHDDWYDEDQHGDRADWERECRASLVEIDESDYNYALKHGPRNGYQRHLANIVRGWHVDDPEALAILGRTDWAQTYPVCDDEGYYIGEIIDSQAEGYLNYRDLALVAVEDAEADHDGYGHPKNMA